MMGSVDDYEEYGSSGGLPRPYTSQTFSTKLAQFESLIADLTYQDSEQTAEERRQAINGRSFSTKVYCTVGLRLYKQCCICCPESYHFVLGNFPFKIGLNLVIICICVNVSL